MHHKKQTDSRLSNPTIGAVGAASIALVVVLLWSFPLVLSPNQSILGHPGDSLTALSRWEHWQLSGRYIERPLLNITGILLSRILGPIAAYNVVMLSSFPLAACTAFLLFHYLVRSTSAALIAALFFALCPYHWARSQGHLYLAHIQWIPLVFLTALVFLKNPSILRGAGFLLSFALLLASSFYYGFFTALIGITLVIPGLIYAAKTKRLPRYWRALIILVLAIIGTLPITHSYLTWLSSRPAPRVELLDELFRYSARISEYLLPGSFSGLARIWHLAPAIDSLHRSNEVEQAIFVGWVPLLAAAAGLLIVLRNRPSSTRQGQPLWKRGELMWILTAGGVALLYSAPPAVNLFGQSFLLPNYYVSRVVPFFRSYARMSVFVQLAVSAVAAVGLSALAKLPKGHHLVGLVLALNIIEFTPIPPPRVSRLVPTKPVYLWLARREHGADIVEFPFNTRATPRTSFRTYNKRLHGHMSIEELPSFDLRHTALLDTTRCDDLCAAGVGLILLHHKGPEPVLQIYKDRPERGRNRPGSWPCLAAEGRITYHAHFPGTVILSPEPLSCPVSISRSDGVGPWAQGLDLIGAPMSAASGFLLHNTYRKPFWADVDLIFRRVSPVHWWRVFVNDLQWAVVPQTADTLALNISNVELFPGVTTLRVEALGNSFRPLERDATQPVAFLLRARIKQPQHGRVD